MRISGYDGSGTVRWASGETTSTSVPLSSRFLMSLTSVLTTPFVCGFHASVTSARRLGTKAPGNAPRRPSEVTEPTRPAEISFRFITTRAYGGREANPLRLGEVLVVNCQQFSGGAALI